MKMNKSLIALCYQQGYWQARSNQRAMLTMHPQNTSDAPAIPICCAATTHWTQSINKNPDHPTGDRRQQLNVPGISGPVAAYSVPGKHWRTDPDADRLK